MTRGLPNDEMRLGGGFSLLVRSFFFFSEGLVVYLFRFVFTFLFLFARGGGLCLLACL